MGKRDAIAKRISEIDWQTWEAQDPATLVFVVTGGRILLIRKKRGLGAGKINGPGGRLEPGESPLDCAIREVQEELRTTPTGLEMCGENLFQFVDGYSTHVYVFRASGCDQEPEGNRRGRADLDAHRTDPLRPDVGRRRAVAAARASGKAVLRTVHLRRRHDARLRGRGEAVARAPIRPSKELRSWHGSQEEREEDHGQEDRLPKKKDRREADSRLRNPQRRSEKKPEDKVSSMSVNLGHVFSLRPRVSKTFRQADFLTARQLLQDEDYANIEEAARAVAEKALDLTHKGPPKRGFKPGR